MDKFIVSGGLRLRGSVEVSGSKNAALPILIATLLTDEPCTVDNVPDLRDIRTTVRLLEILGKRVTVRGNSVRIEPRRRLSTVAPYDVVKEMRASVLVAGPLLGRFKRVRVPLPGGCAIGLRPIDIHIKGFQAMGAVCVPAGGDLVITAKRFKSSKVRLRFPSVGATENLMMLAAIVPGTTVIENAAREPEIADLGAFLGKMGASVSGAGTRRIVVRGAARLAGARHRVIPDRLETGTFLIACAAAGGRITLRGAEPRHLGSLIEALRKTGCKLTIRKDHIHILSRRRPRPFSVRTRPYPGFPTDLQPQWMAYMCLARGTSRIREDIFDRRFLHAAELARLGAHVALHGSAVTVRGVSSLQGASIMASDIRAGAALIVAALAAKGRTEIHRVYHIDRGYERIEQRLRRLGGRIRRVR